MPPTYLKIGWLTFLKKYVIQIRVGVCVILWDMWNVWNDFISNVPRTSTFLVVIPMVVHWISTWSFLQPVEERQDMDSVYKRLDMVARDAYNWYGWWLDNRSP
jgi:hypothetical protein